MKLFSTLALFVVAGLALLTAAVPTVFDSMTDVSPVEYTDVTTATCCDWSPLKVHHGFATVEVWVGRPAINSGFLIGEEWKVAIDHVTKSLCAERDGECVEGGAFNTPRYCINVEEVTKLKPFPVEWKWTQLCFEARGKWENPHIHQLLVDSVAMVMVGFTDDAYSNPNCYEFPGRMMCNIPNAVHVRLPPIGGQKNSRVNWMDIKMTDGGAVQHEFHCCETRNKVDARLDTLQDRMKEVFPVGYEKFRLVNCMVNSWMTCEQCYEKFNVENCKKCGKKCIKL
ncbi:hypothetical protein J4E93_005966 [Alternaria ventricosa]|uniref:uncharacterized protein n=1 Tax=Alternaria ventricosa TaxID=1187951 RepID=UPI0020C4FA29|nr:uncharacterized protein J4E93_005966 [Alternaria ventricosa]KAI4645166.1 hypothetical protein J4E93_005966 [Alternaria ventricosa]